MKEPERIEKDGKIFAEVIWAGTRVETTHFFSLPESSFQFGLLAHQTGFDEPAHYHHPFVRQIGDLQQMFVMQLGKVAVDLYDDHGKKFREIILGPGDAIVLMHGAHGLRVLETFQAISVKQGPFLGSEKDKVFIRTKN